jgi:hypothetical protein
MVVKQIIKTKGGEMRLHEPPYTPAEEAEFYNRTAGGPVTVARADDKTANKNAKSSRIKTRP